MFDEFAELDQYYPGSRERRQAVTASAPATGISAADLLDGGTLMILHGIRIEFFTIGQIARAINRRAVTLRSWEADGTLPPSGYVKSSDDPRGRRRLYTRQQAEGIITIVSELGLMDSTKRLARADLKARLWALFNDLKGTR